MRLRSLFLASLCLIAGLYYAVLISSMGSHGTPLELYPLWNGTRAILHRVDPYSVEVTRQTQAGMDDLPESQLPAEQLTERFSFPVHASFLVMPLALLDFPVANRILFWLLIALTAFTVGWLRGRWDGTTALYSILVFASYPVIYDIKSRQPTLLFLGLAVAGFALLRARQVVIASILCVLSTGKPQIGVPVLLPLLSWSIGAEDRTTRFAKWVAFSAFVSFILSSLVSPGWLIQWKDALRTYLQRDAEPSIISSLFGKELGPPVSYLVLAGLLVALWLHRRSELLFQMSVSVTFMEVILPYRAYNAVLLMIPVIWIADNARSIAAAGMANQLALAGVKASLVGSWIANGLGVLLLYTSSPAANWIAWRLPSVMILVVLASLVIMLSVLLLSRRPSAHLRRCDNSGGLQEVHANGNSNCTGGY